MCAYTQSAGVDAWVVVRVIFRVATRCMRRATGEKTASLHYPRRVTLDFMDKRANGTKIMFSHACLFGLEQ